MANTIKVKLDTLYRVSPVKENFVSAGKPTIEIYSANGDVTIRATTNEEYVGDPSSLPLVTDEAAANEVYVTDCEDSIRFLSFSCSDSDAVILVSGLNLMESPQYKVDTYSVTDNGTGYQVGDILMVEDDTIVPASFEVVTYSQLHGALTSVNIESVGEFSEDCAGDVNIEYGDGQGGVVTLTSTATTSYVVDDVTIANAGSGYTVDDVLVYTSADEEEAAFVVTEVDSGGEILAVEIHSAGEFATDVAGTVSVTGGTGSGAELTLVTAESTMYSIDTATIKSTGHDYGTEGFEIDLGDDAVLSFETGDVGADMTVRMLEDGEFENRETETEFDTVGGSGEGAKITISTHSIY